MVYKLLLFVRSGSPGGWDSIYQNFIASASRKKNFFSSSFTAVSIQNKVSHNWNTTATLIAVVVVFLAVGVFVPGMAWVKGHASQP